MSITKSHILKLCTLTEAKLVEKSLSSNIKKLSADELQKNIDRTRKLRNKQRDLYRRQTLKAREQGKTFLGMKAAGMNARTKEKVVLFEKVLDAFEERLSFLKQKIKTSKSKALKPKTAVSKKTPKPLVQGSVTAKTASKKQVTVKAKKTLTIKPSSKSNLWAAKNTPPKVVSAGAFVSEGAQVAAQRSQMQQSRSKPIQGHISSAGKRAQAKRDSR
ncbi:MAG: hypothetical protein RBT70_09340 [Alphaproteobacteria bacterium]|jgi:hypothetical protein|nr:hypothetical protein [Alphaproteobacteria bacterium]